MKRRIKSNTGVLIFLAILLFCLFLLYFYFAHYMNKGNLVENSNKNIQTSPTYVATLKPLPVSKILENNYHIYQTFNNCGPASLSMALSYYNINISQEVLGNSLRPYQIQNGNNDDKSVTLEEMAIEAEKYNLKAINLPNGNIEVIKQLINYDIPVITRTWLKVDEDIGHYRIIKGYNQKEQILIQDDSLQGKNLVYKYGEFEKIWEKFNYEYLIIYPKEKDQIVREILAENYYKDKAWKNSVQTLKTKIDNGDNTTITKFNLVVSLTKIGLYKEAAELFSVIEKDISKRALWYNIEPIYAFYKIGDYAKALILIDNVLNNGNTAYSELYIIKGDIYKELGDISQAKKQYELALKFNTNFKEAKDRLIEIRN